MISLMLAMNIGLAMVQGAIDEVNPAGPAFFNVSESPYASYVVNGTLVVDDSYLPSEEAVQEDPVGNFFTDAFSNLRSWTREKLGPLSFASNVLKQPYGFLKDVGIPNPIAVALGVFWYLIALIILVSWWIGR